MIYTRCQLEKHIVSEAACYNSKSPKPLSNMLTKEAYLINHGGLGYQLDQMTDVISIQSYM